MESILRFEDPGSFSYHRFIIGDRGMGAKLIGWEALQGDRDKTKRCPQAAPLWDFALLGCRIRRGHLLTGDKKLREANVADVPRTGPFGNPWKGCTLSMHDARVCIGDHHRATRNRPW